MSRALLALATVYLLALAAVVLLVVGVLVVVGTIISRVLTRASRCATLTTP